MFRANDAYIKMHNIPVLSSQAIWEQFNNAAGNNTLDPPSFLSRLNFNCSLMKKVSVDGSSVKFRGFGRQLCLPLFQFWRVDFKPVASNVLETPCRFRALNINGLYIIWKVFSPFKSSSVLLEIWIDTIQLYPNASDKIPGGCQLFRSTAFWFLQ